MENSDKYVIGFNSGYLLRKHQPVLAKKLISGITTSSDYIEGLIDGTKQLEFDLESKLTESREKQKIQKKQGKNFEF